MHVFHNNNNNEGIYKAPLHKKGTGITALYNDTKYINKRLEQVSLNVEEDCSTVLEQKHKNPYWKNTNEFLVLLAIWCLCLNKVHCGENVRLTWSDEFS